MNRPTIQTCPNCNAPRIPHRVCMTCGQYNSETIVVKKAAED